MAIAGVWLCMPGGLEPFTLPKTTHIGRVALRVASIDDVLPVYRTIGLAGDRTGRTASVSAGDDPPLILFTEDPKAQPRPRDAAGLYHLAIRVPDRPALGDVLRRIQNSEVDLTGASDHRVSEALYMRDPEGNGIEVYRDRPRDEWPTTPEGHVAMDTLPLDLRGLDSSARGTTGMPAGTDIGHVHLEVTALSEAEAFYVDRLGLNVRARYGDQASFLAAGDYHHHLGLNTWNGRSKPASDTLGLDWYEIVLPDRDTLETITRRLNAKSTSESSEAVDPDGIRIRLSSAP